MNGMMDDMVMLATEWNVMLWKGWLSALFITLSGFLLLLLLHATKKMLGEGLTVLGAKL